VGPRLIGFEFVVEGRTCHGIITAGAVQHLYTATHLDTDDKLLEAVAGSAFIAERAARRAQGGKGGDEFMPVFLAAADFD
jgi:hypothetical protein